VAVQPSSAHHQRCLLGYFWGPGTGDWLGTFFVCTVLAGGGGDLTGAPIVDCQLVAAIAQQSRLKGGADRTSHLWIELVVAGTEHGLRPLPRKL
jgi:hypothetical protein